MLRLSYSKINLFNTCKYRYKLKYIDEIDEQKENNKALILGSLVHKVLERYTKQENCKIEKILDEEYSNTNTTDREVYTEACDIINTFKSKPIDLEKIEAVEERIEFKIGKFDTVAIVDRIDRSENGLHIIDYKTNRRLYTSEDMQNNLQLSLYGYACYQAYGELPYIYSMDMLRFGYKQNTFRTKEQIERDMRYVKHVGFAIEKEKDFEPTLNDNCYFCPFKDKCKKYKSSTSEDVEYSFLKKSPEEIYELSKEIGAKIKKLEHEKKLADNIIKSEIYNNGSLDTGSEVLTTTSFTKRKYNLQETVSILSEELGIGKLGVLLETASISAGDVKKLVQKNTEGDKYTRQKIHERLDLEACNLSRYNKIVKSRKDK